MSHAPPSTRPTYARRITFGRWLADKSIDASTIASENEEAIHIGQSVFLELRSRAEKGKQGALATKIRRTRDLYAQYCNEVPLEVIGHRPLDLSRESDRAYLRVQKRRAKARKEQRDAR